MSKSEQLIKAGYLVSLLPSSAVWSVYGTEVSDTTLNIMTDGPNHAQAIRKMLGLGLVVEQSEDFVSYAASHGLTVSLLSPLIAENEVKKERMD